MSRASLERLAPLAGVVFVALGVIGTLIYPSEMPDFVGDPAEIVAFYTGNDDDILKSQVLYLISGIFLIWFFGALRATLVAAEGAIGRLSATAYGAGIAGVALMLAAAATELAAVLRVDEQGGIDPQVATVMWDLSSVLWGVAAPIAFATLLLASALLSFRFGALPKWLGAISVVLGIALAVPPIAWMAMLGFIVWVLVTSVVLYLRAAPAASTAA